MKILSRSFSAEILVLQGFPAGLRDSYFIRDNFDYPEIQDNQTFSIAGSRGGFGRPKGHSCSLSWPDWLKPGTLSTGWLKMFPACIDHDGGRTFAAILDAQWTKLGYGVEWQCS